MWVFQQGIESCNSKLSASDCWVCTLVAVRHKESGTCLAHQINGHFGWQRGTFQQRLHRITIYSVEKYIAYECLTFTNNNETIFVRIAVWCTSNFNHSQQQQPTITQQQIALISRSVVFRAKLFSSFEIPSRVLWAFFDSKPRVQSILFPLKPEGCFIFSVVSLNTFSFWNFKWCIFSMHVFWDNLPFLFSPLFFFFVNLLFTVALCLSKRIDRNFLNRTYYIDDK